MNLLSRHGRRRRRRLLTANVHGAKRRQISLQHIRSATTKADCSTYIGIFALIASSLVFYFKQLVRSRQLSNRELRWRGKIKLTGRGSYADLIYSSIKVHHSRLIAEIER